MSKQELFTQGWGAEQVAHYDATKAYDERRNGPFDTEQAGEREVTEEHRAPFMAVRALVAKRFREGLREDQADRLCSTGATEYDGPVPRFDVAYDLSRQEVQTPRGRYISPKLVISGELYGRYAADELGEYALSLMIDVKDPVRTRFMSRIADPLVNGKTVPEDYGLFLPVPSFNGQEISHSPAEHVKSFVVSAIQTVAELNGLQPQTAGEN